RAKNLTVMNLPPETSQTLAKLAQIKMQLHCTIQDGEIWLADSNDRVQVNPVTIKTSSAPDR
ncbi:MAG: YaeQ family protein, partial [Gammaproteobacteria bacterium]|nr:YaeQ family protein [Gammaproteobacteria bacterium]